MTTTTIRCGVCKSANNPETKNPSVSWVYVGGWCTRLIQRKVLHETYDNVFSALGGPPSQTVVNILASKEAIRIVSHAPHGRRLLLYLAPTLDWQCPLQNDTIDMTPGWERFSFVGFLWFRSWGGIFGSGIFGSGVFGSGQHWSLSPEHGRTTNTIYFVPSKIGNTDGCLEKLKFQFVSFLSPALWLCPG